MQQHELRVARNRRSNLSGPDPLLDTRQKGCVGCNIRNQFFHWLLSVALDKRQKTIPSNNSLRSVFAASRANVKSKLIRVSANPYPQLLMKTRWNRISLTKRKKPGEPKSTVSRPQTEYVPRRQFEVKVQREVLPACTVALTVTRAYQAAAGPAPTTKAAENKEEEPAETTESSEIQSQPYRAKRYTITGPEPIAPPRLGEGNGSQKELPTRPRPSYAPKMAPFQRLANAILNP